MERLRDPCIKHLLNPTFCDPDTVCETIKMSRSLPCLPKKAKNLVGKARHNKNSLPHDVNSVRLAKESGLTQVLLIRTESNFYEFRGKCFKNALDL